MFSSKLQLPVLARFMTALFVVQLFAMGFCVMLPQANAMAMASDMPMEHCDNMIDMPNESEAQQSACSHCDQPDELWQPIKTSLDITGLSVAILAWSSLSFQTHPTVSLTSILPTGPPRSSTLLYTITQRIRL